MAAILPTKSRWGNSKAVFAAGPTGGTLLRVNGGINACDVAASGGVGGKGTAGAKLRDGSGETSDESLLGLEAMLGELGLDSETLKLVGSASRLGLGDKSPRAGLMDVLTELKEAEERAKDAAEVLEGLGEDSAVPGKVGGFWGYFVVSFRFIYLCRTCLLRYPVTLSLPCLQNFRLQTGETLQYFPTSGETFVQ